MPSAFDTWDSYLWEPGGPVLRNLYDLRDGSELAAREYSETNKQQVRIAIGMVQIPRTHDAEHLRAIHRQLFGNVYEWAGEYRTVGIRKGAAEFARPPEIFRYLDDAALIIRSADWATMDRDQFATTAAEVFAYVNQAHPFREGNGRASKLFMQHVAEMSPFRIDYNPVTSGVSAEVWNQASSLSGPDLGSYEPVPDELVPVFKALTVDGPEPASMALPDDPRDQAERPAAYPRTAGDLLGGASAGSQEIRPNRPAEGSGPRYDVGRE